MHVTAVIVTYRRPEALLTAVRAVLDQTTAPDAVLVVDNGGQGEAQDTLRGVPGVRVLDAGGNVGYGAGLAAGIAAGDPSTEVYWLLDDDSAPHADVLQRLVAVARASSRAGLIGTVGGSATWGVPRYYRYGVEHSVAGERVREADVALVDGALVTAEAVLRVGSLRSDFFMMFEDVEFSGRLRRHGYQVLVVPDLRVDRQHLGSTSASGAPPWRTYYQTRNHLLTALATRRPTHVLGWAGRQLVLTAALVRVPDQRRERLAMRGRGVLDGLRGRRGRTVEPG